MESPPHNQCRTQQPCYVRSPPTLELWYQRLVPVSDQCTFDRGNEKLARKLHVGVDGSLRGLADLDEVTVRITHVTAQFVTKIIEGLGEELCAFLGPIFIACVNVCNAQIEEATHAVEVMWWREPYIRLVRRRTSARV